MNSLYPISPRLAMRRQERGQRPARLFNLSHQFLDGDAKRRSHRYGVCDRSIPEVVHRDEYTAVGFDRMEVERAI